MAGNEDDSPISGDLLASYRDVLRALMPREYLTKDGWLRLPNGEARQTAVSMRSWREVVMGGRLSGSFYFGLEKPALLYCFARNKQHFGDKDYEQITALCRECLGKDKSVVSLGRAWHLAHESFHDIQAYLYSYFPDQAERLDASVRKHIGSFAEVYRRLPHGLDWRHPQESLGRYSLDGLVATDPAESLRPKTFNAMCMFLRTRFPGSAPAILSVIGEATLMMSRCEIVPVLICACREGSAEAGNLVELILRDAGLGADGTREFLLKSLPESGPRFNRAIKPPYVFRAVGMITLLLGLMCAAWVGYNEWIYTFPEYAEAASADSRGKYGFRGFFFGVFFAFIGLRLLFRRYPYP